MTTANRLSVQGSISQQRRQIEFWGEENQLKLFNSKALILGSDILGQMVLGCCCGLGVGDILMLDNRKSSEEDLDFLSSGLRGFKGAKKMEVVERNARAINDNINVRALHSKFSRSIIQCLNFKPDVIVETQNDPLLKEEALDFAIACGAEYISAYSGRKRSVTSRFDGKDIESVLDDEGVLREGPAESFTSGVSAGMIVDEIRKSLFGMNEGDRPLERKITYNLESLCRTGIGSEKRISLEAARDRDLRVLVAGAGAIGNYVALNLALSGFRNIDVMDFDKVDYHNLARQIMLSGRVGDPKARVLSQRIRSISGCNALGHEIKLGEESRDFISDGDYGIIFGCFDNEMARYTLSQFALELEIPYIDGATSPLTGNVSVYSPGKTACMRCKKGLLPIESVESCADVPNPSVVIPNIIIGSMMVGEAYHVLNKGHLEGRLSFDTESRGRIYTSAERSADESCPCYGGEK